MRLPARLLVLALVVAVFCTPLFVHLGVADQENDEAIYSYAVESILETGDWMNPRFSPNAHEVFIEKPPLKFWLVALPIRLGVLPDSDLGLRVLDAVFGSLAFLYVFSFGRRMSGWICGAVALLVLFTFETLLVQHGLRGNNMEAALVLAYAGGIYHFLRWAESAGHGEGRAHAFAVGGWFFLGFMTKFVAALFLPAILAAASLRVAAVRSKVVTERRTWIVVAAGIVVLAAPWFVYQMLQPGRGLWFILLGEHVVRRFSDALDPGHLKPWDFYFRSLGDNLSARGALWIVLGGALLVHVRSVRERWLPGVLVLCWFWLPFALMSIGTSKLWHYTYPFLPAVGLAAGYFVASIVAALGDLANGRTEWPPRAAALREKARVLGRQIAARIPGERGTAGAWTWVQRVLLVAALVFLALGAFSLIQHGRFRLIGILVRPQPALRAGVIAVVLGCLAGRGAWVARLAAPMVLLSFMSVAEYRDQIARMAAAEHRVRTSRDCVAAVRRQELDAGRPAPPLLVSLPTGFLHPFFLYYRHLGWDRHDGLAASELMNALDGPAGPRPVLMSRPAFLPAGQPGAARSVVALSEGVIVVLPGPYARCGS